MNHDSIISDIFGCSILHTCIYVNQRYLCNSLKKERLFIEICNLIAGLISKMMAWFVEKTKMKNECWTSLFAPIQPNVKSTTMKNINRTLHYSQGCCGYGANQPEKAECEEGIHLQFYTNTVHCKVQRPLHLGVIYLPDKPPTGSRRKLENLKETHANKRRTHSNAMIRLHIIFVFHNAHHVRLGNRNAINSWSGHGQHQ